MPRLKRRSKAADRRAAKTGAAKRHIKREARAAMTLSDRIRALEPYYSRDGIAAKLNTSIGYVRVVLTQRVGGSSSRADLAYRERRGAGVVADYMRRAYNAVPRDERLAIRAEVSAYWKARGADRRKANWKATNAVLSEGRRRLARGADDDTP